MDPHTELKITKDYFAEQGSFSLQAGNIEMCPRAQKKSFRKESSFMTEGGIGADVRTFVHKR